MLDAIFVIGCLSENSFIRRIFLQTMLSLLSVLYDVGTRNSVRKGMLEMYIAVMVDDSVNPTTPL